MSWLPGWHSAVDSGWWSHFWFWFGIICLLALGASEVVSHFYGLRKDELIEIAAHNADEQRKRDANSAEARRESESKTLQHSLSEARERAAELQQQYDDAERRRSTETAKLQQQLTEANGKVAELEGRRAPRKLTEEQNQVLITALSPFHGQNVSVSSVVRDAEAKAFRDEFVTIVERAGWVHGGRIGEGMYDRNPRGIEVTISQADAQGGRVPQAAVVLVQTLIDLHLVGLSPGDRRPVMFVHPNIPSGSIELRIGPKPDS
jgi:hypothetical protein